MDIPNADTIIKAYKQSENIDEELKQILEIINDNSSLFIATIYKKDISNIRVFRAFHAAGYTLYDYCDKIRIAWLDYKCPKKDREFANIIPSSYTMFKNGMEKIQELILKECDKGRIKLELEKDYVLRINSNYSKLLETLRISGFTVDEDEFECFIKWDKPPLGLVGSFSWDVWTCVNRVMECEHYKKFMNELIEILQQIKKENEEQNKVETCLQVEYNECSIDNIKYILKFLFEEKGYSVWINDKKDELVISWL